MRQSGVYDRRERIAIRDRDLPVRRALQQDVVPPVAVPVVCGKLRDAGPSWPLKLLARRRDATAIDADAQSARVVLVRDLRAPIPVHVERGDAEERAVHALRAVRRRGDACDRIGLVHEEVVGPVHVEVQALAGTPEECAALGVFVANGHRLLVDRLRSRREAAGRKRVAHAHHQAVAVVIGDLRPGDVAEAVAIHVESAVVRHLLRCRDAGRNRRTEATGRAREDLPAERGREHQQVAAAVAVVVEGHPDAVRRGDAGVDLRAQAAVGASQPIADCRGGDGAAARKNDVADAVAIDVGGVENLMAGLRGESRHHGRERGGAAESGAAVLPGEYRRCEALQAVPAALADGGKPAAAGRRQRRLVSHFVAAQHRRVVQDVDPREADHLPDRRARHVRDIHFIVGPRFVREGNTVRGGNAGRGIRVVADLRDADAAVRDVLEVLEVNDIARAIADAVERPDARAVHGIGGGARIDARIGGRAVLEHAAVGRLDHEVARRPARAGRPRRSSARRPRSWRSRRRRRN